MKTLQLLLISFLIFALLAAGCVQPAPNTRAWALNTVTAVPISLSSQSLYDLIPTQRAEGSVYVTPTPDAPHNIPSYQANAGQGVLSSDFKIIPDSELVYGPISATLDVSSFIQQSGGYLSRYSEDVDGVVLSGIEIVKQISYEYSVNPRLLLSLLEYQSGWVTQGQVSDALVSYPLGLADNTRAGLYKQLSWAANQLNYGYYLWKVGAISSTTMADGNLAVFPATLNAGTVAVQRTLALVKDVNSWTYAVSEEGIFATYALFFWHCF
jgi:hypothetical protein